MNLNDVRKLGNVIKHTKDYALVEISLTGKSARPCKKHHIAFGDKDIPEAKNYDLRKCRTCKWYIKRKK